MRAALNAANVGIRHPYCLGATTSTRYFTGFSDTIVQFFNAVRATQFSPQNQSAGAKRSPIRQTVLHRQPSNYNGGSASTRSHGRRPLRKLPSRLRPIYAFARSADDIADEGDALPAERLAALQAYDDALDAIAAGAPLDGLPDAAMWRRLAAAIGQYGLPLQLLRDLLSAFRQDVVTTRYPDYALLLDYCRRSANPVGRLMLALYGEVDATSLRQSDAVCSALQLINFWQDVAIDIDKGRIYLPLEDLARFGVGEDDIRLARTGPAWKALMRFEVERARALMLEGAPLAKRLPGRIGWELRLVVQGGLRILDAIEAARYDVFRHRPQLKKLDWLVLGWRALRM
jgi:squalene synthase HpnC